jgi:dissimilatory sulfite reductase (desulfoviridin) alpha/beta subunit
MINQHNYLFFTIKPTRCTNFPNLLRHESLHVLGSSSAHHQEFIHCTLGNDMCHTGTVHTAFEQDQDGTTAPTWSCSKAVFKLE